MKRLLSLALISTLGFSATLVVEKCYYIGPIAFCNNCTSGDSTYDTIADALNNANSGDEIVICPGIGGVKATYSESDLNISESNLYIHSYRNDASKVEIKDDSGKPIFNIKNSGIRLEALTITQDSNQIDINVSAYNNDNSSDGMVSNLTFKDLVINSQGKGIVLKYNVNNVFDDVNITSADVSFESDWSEFYGVKILNSEFNQTNSGRYVFITYATNLKNNSFYNTKIYSKGYGLYFGYGIGDTNFSNFYLYSNNDTFVVNSNDVNNIRFIDSNISSDNGRAISINNGSLVNSEFSDFNLSANYEALYTYYDIQSSRFNNFIIDGSYGFYSNRYIKNSSFNNGTIKASETGMYSSEEFNQSSLNNLYVKASNYGFWFSENSDSGDVNDENNLTNLVIIQTSNSSSSYSGIKFKKKVNNSLFKDINLTTKERGIWLSTGGKYNKFDTLEINASDSNAFVNSNPLYYNTFLNSKFYSDSSSAISFNDDVKYNNFENIYVESNQSNGIYSPTGVYIDDNNFSNFKIFADDYGVYFKDDISENNFTNFYVRVNRYSFKLAKNSTNDYFFDVDLNGTKGIEFNISNGDVVQKAKILTTRNEPIYFDTISSDVSLYDLNLTSTKDNCIYVANLNADLNISTKVFYKNELNCSDYHGIQISNDSNYNLRVSNTNLKINASSVNTSRALIYAKSLNTLYLYNDNIDGNKTRRGVYVSSNLDNIYIYKTLFKNTNDTAVYVNRANDNVEITDNNISSSEKYGIYIYSVDSGFNKGEIKRNYFLNNKDYAIALFYNNEKSADFEIWTNCFYYNQNNDDYSQAYTYDTNAKYDDGSAGNFWSDWNESGKYQIDPSSIGLYDNHPLYYCPLNVLFDARDVDRNFTDRNISIKIAGKEFNLTIFDITGGKYKGTVCSRILNSDDNNTAYTGWMRLYFDDEIEKNLTNIDINHSVRSAIVHIIWADGDKSCNDVLNDDHNSSFSTDTFAIRPYKFRVKMSKMPLYAGEEFDLNVSAIGFNGKTLIDYNRSDRNISVEMNRSSLVCDYLDAEFNLSSLDFKNGDSNNSAKFDEVGEMNLTIFDNDFDLAKGGEDECNDSNECISVYGYDGKDSKGVFCCYIEANPKWDINLSEIEIKVYDLNITNHSIKTTNNKDWIYMDSNLSEFNASPTIEITAFNKTGKQLHNFDKLCLAKDMNISFKYNVHNDNGDINLTYLKTVDDNNKSIKDFNKTIEVNKSMFVKGDTNASYAFNVERNSSKALYIVYANLKKIDFITNGIAKNENNLSTDLNISMYYGNVKTFDVTTNKDSIDVKVYFVVYDDDSNYKPSNENKAYNWYLNLKHTDNEGKFSPTIHISDDYTAKDKYNSDFDVSVDNVSDGEQVIHITRKSKKIHFAVFHLTFDSNASHWLWFSYTNKDYNDSLNSSCANHFCFAITWKEANNNSASRVVKSGNLLGTEAPVSEYNSTAKGVKIYR